MTETRKGEKTRERILKQTRQVLITRGFYNTSISDIIAATGVKKGNLYYHFGSKEELGMAVLQDAKEEFFGILDKALAGSSPLQRITSFLDAMLNEQRKNNFVGGCLFGNTALEMSDTNPEFAEVIHELFRRWSAILEGHLDEAVSRGELDTPLTSRQLAGLIISAIEGGIMMARAGKDEKDLLNCIESLKKLLSCN